MNKGQATESGWSAEKDAEGIEITDNSGTDYVWTPIGYKNAFYGKFDGQGHEISGLKATPTTTEDEAYLGLFGNVGTGAELKN